MKRSTSDIDASIIQELKKVKSYPHIVSIDNDCLLLIFSYLRGYDLIGKYSLVCKEWFHLIMKEEEMSNNFWKEIIIRELGFEPLELPKINISFKDYYFYKLVRRKLYFSYYLKELMKEENIHFTKEFKDFIFPILFKDKCEQIVKNNQLNLFKRKIIYSVENVMQDDKLINYKTISLNDVIEEKMTEVDDLNYNYESITNFTKKVLNLKELLQKEGKPINDILQNYKIYFQETYPINKVGFQLLNRENIEGLLLITNNTENIQPDMFVGNETCKVSLRRYFEENPNGNRGRGKGGKGLKNSSSLLKGLGSYTLFATETEMENKEKLLEYDIDSGCSVLLLKKDDNNLEKNEITNESIESIKGFIKLDELDINYSPDNIDEAIMKDSDNKCHIIDDSHFAIGESKIGGSPDLPKEMTWPYNGDIDEDEDEEKLLFIAQMNMKHLSFYDYDGTIPKDEGMIYFWAMQGTGMNNTRKGKILSKVVTFVSDKEIKEMGGLERRRTDEALSPKRLKFRNIFGTFSKELDEKGFTLIKQLINYKELTKEEKEQCWEDDVYNLKKLLNSLQNVKYKHYKRFGELLKYTPNYYGEDERLEKLDNEIFRDFEVFCGQKAEPNEHHEGDCNATYQLSSIKSFKDVTPIFSLYPECVDSDSAPYFHYGISFKQLIEKREIDRGLLVITEVD
ncbi:hypothetical protein ABK040_009269 [Willaertia magna]